MPYGDRTSVTGGVQLFLYVLWRIVPKHFKGQD